ncbi:MAG: hypothetical protein IPJ76_09385 [Flavobacteriales bacterium]|nr:MAG: hypothetical protein IPJ76_09385 [Flavobacteriales bacterium]
MRRASPLFLLCSASVLAQAPFEFADQRSLEVWYSGCAVADSVWVVGGSYGNDQGGSAGHFVQGFLPDGDAAWTVPFMDSLGGAIPWDLAELPGGGALVVGPHDGCDVLMPTSLLALYDAVGNVVWSTAFHQPSAKAVEVGPTGKVLAWSYDGAFIADQNGDSLTAFEFGPLGWSSSVKLIWDSDTTLLVARTNTVLERRTLGTQLLASNSLGSIVAIVFWQGHRLVLDANGQLTAVDAALVAIGTIDPGVPIAGGQFVKGDTTLWLMGADWAVEFDTSLNIINTIAMDPDGVFPATASIGYAAMTGAVGMAGSVSTASRPAGILRTVSTNGAIAQHEEDVAVQLLSIDSAWVEFSGNYVFTRANVTVEVTNVSATLLDKVVLNHWSLAWMCSSVGTTLGLDGLGLAQGGTTIAALTDLWLDYGPWGWPAEDQTICISALSPNAKYDRDHSDNWSCDSVHFDLGIGELSEEGPFVLVQDWSGENVELMFRSPVSESLSFALMDMSGRLVASEVISSGMVSFRINTAGLSCGAHIVRLCGASGPCWQRKWLKG